MRLNKVIVNFYGEIYKIEICPETHTISDLKDKLELLTGIPVELQKISFLDRLELGTVNPNRKLKHFGILPKSKLRLSLVSEIDYRDIVFAARQNNLAVLKLQGLISDVLVPPGYDKNFDTAVERTKVIEKSWIEPKKQSFGLYTNPRTLQKLKTPKNDKNYIEKFNKVMEKTKALDMKNWKNYRLFLCALSAIKSKNLVLLQILVDQNPLAILKMSTNITKRNLLHIGSCLSDKAFLTNILYKFKSSEQLLGKKDKNGLTPAKLAISVGKRSSSQVILYFDWQRRTDLKTSQTTFQKTVGRPTKSAKSTTCL